MQTRRWLPAFLRADALLNFVGTLTLLVAAGPVADVVGLSDTWPLYALAAVFAVNGVELVLTAREPKAGMLTTLAVVDAVFIALVVAYAVSAEGAETWARAAMLLTATATLVTMTAKLTGRRARTTA